MSDTEMGLWGPENVPKHQSTIQLRPASYLGGDSGRFATVRPEDQRLQQAFEDKRAIVSPRGR